MKRLFVGDLHGNFNLIPHLRKLYPDYDEIIIVGDFGLGFGHGDVIAWEMAEEINKPPFIRFIRGNHDNLDVCKQFVDGGIKFIRDGHVEDGILFVGGAWSIDANFRTPGVSWWYNEELNDFEWDEIFKNLEGKYEDIHTVVTHDCPNRVAHLVLGAGKYVHKTRTSMNLDLLLNRLPNVRLWIFGHYHEYHDFRKGNTRFVCLPDKVGKTLTMVDGKVKI